MATVVGLESAEGVVLAGDRQLVAEGRVRSTAEPHVHEWGDVGVAVVGDAAAMDRFVREFESELDAYRMERGDPTVEAATRLASRVVAGVEALVAARDEDGEARLRAVDGAGGVTHDDRAALGSGAAVALGSLEGADPSASSDLPELERRAREALAAAAERDAGTGGEVDVWRLANGGDG